MASVGINKPDNGSGDSCLRVGLMPTTGGVIEMSMQVYTIGESGMECPYEY